MNTLKPYIGSSIKWAEGMPLINDLREENPYADSHKTAPIDELLIDSIMAMEEVDSAIFKLLAGE